MKAFFSDSNERSLDFKEILIQINFRQSEVLP